MTTTLRVAVALAILGLVAQEAAAQWNAARFGAARNQVYTTFGLDPAFVTSVGYARIVPVLGREWQLGVEVGAAAFNFDRRDFRTRVQLRTSIVRWRSLRLTGSAAFLTRGTENVIYRGFDFGSDLTGTVGVYRQGWFFAGEFGFDKAIITHLVQSDWYRRYYYPEAKDGWYLTGGGTFHYGATTGVAIGAAELALRAGWRRTETWDNSMPPMYASLGLGFRF
jgi:hypothetical protein